MVLGTQGASSAPNFPRLCSRRTGPSALTWLFGPHSFSSISALNKLPLSEGWSAQTPRTPWLCSLWCSDPQHPSPIPSSNPGSRPTSFRKLPRWPSSSACAVPAELSSTQRLQPQSGALCPAPGLGLPSLPLTGGAQASAPHGQGCGCQC